MINQSSNTLCSKDYMSRLLKYLDSIRENYGNIITIPATVVLGRSNKGGDGNIEKSKYIERKIISDIGAQQCYLVSLEYYNGMPILVVGKPDGLVFRGREVIIYEVKSLEMFKYNNKSVLNNEKVFGAIYKPILIHGLYKQLMIYRYLFEKMISYGLINNVKRIDLYGYIIIYSGRDNLEQLKEIKKGIIDNIKEIGNFLRNFGVHIEGLKGIESIIIGKEEFYYLEIIVRVDYNERLVKNHLNRLFSSLYRTKIIRDL
jgi:hypothetical protein